MKLTVNFCGESLFTWKGDHSWIEKLSTELATLAVETGHSGMTIAENVLRSVGKGLPAEETTGRVQCRGSHIVCCIRIQTTQRRYADYAPAWHFEFNLSPQADAEAVAVESKPAHLAQMRLEICRRDLVDMIPDRCNCRK